MESEMKLNIIVIGGGELITRRYCQYVNHNKSTNLFAIVEPGEIGSKISSDFNTRLFHSISELISFCDEESYPYPDGAIVCTPNHSLVKLSAELASLGIHLLVANPISMKVEDAKALLYYTRKKGVKLLIGQHRRFNPCIIETKKNLNKVGTPIAIQGSWVLHKNDSYFDITPWRTDSSFGRDALINLAQNIDLLQYILGEIERVFVEPLRKQNMQYHNIDEGVVLTIRFKNGVCGTFICSDNESLPFNFEADPGKNQTTSFRSGLYASYRIFGSKGTLSVPDLTLFHQPNASNEHETSWLYPIQKEKLVENQDSLISTKSLNFQLDHFVNILNGVEEPLCNVENTISCLLCVDAIIESMNTGLPQTSNSLDKVEENISSLGSLSL